MITVNNASTFLFVAVLSVLLQPPAMAENKAEQHVVQANAGFTSNLYKALADSDENVFFSPISVHAVLAMAYQGAQGSTAERFAAALQVTDATIAGEGYNAVMNSLNDVPNVTLLMANKVYLMEGSKLLEAFSTAVTKQFLSEVQLLDFNKSEASAKTINGWVEEKTKEKIKDLIQPADLTAFTRLVLVNAIYFKGNWRHKFNADLTKTEPFYINNKDKVDVQMMHIKENFRYKEDKELDAQLLEMFYTNDNLSMVIILPNKRDGIKELEKKLENVALANITDDMYSTEVNVALPRFKIEQKIDLKEPLEKLGLGEIFDEKKANFRGMIPLDLKENLYVSKVVQKAFIEVNEEGAEAAAATGLHILKKRCLQIPEEFLVNRPFVFMIAASNRNANNIRDNTIIFYGRVTAIASSRLPAARDEL